MGVKDKLYPIDGNKNFQLIKNIDYATNVTVGDYSYYDAKDGELFSECILYHYPVLQDELIIGKFVQIGPGIEIMMNGAAHRMDGSTYPFNLIQESWQKYTPNLDQLPFKGNTVIGNDVWIGKSVRIMPGVTIGDGAIIAAYSVVTKDVEPYSIVGGNPSRKIRLRYSKEVIDELLDIAWWNFDEDLLEEAIPCVLNNDIEALRKMKVTRI